MQNSLDAIVADLVALDPEFAKMESEIRALARKMISAKPDCEIDSEFKNCLKNELLARIDEMKNAPKSSFNFFKMQKLFYSLGGAVVAVAIFFGVQNLDRFSDEINFVDDSIQKSETQISSVAPRAFGSFADESVDLSSSMAIGKGGGGGVATESAESRIAPDGDFEIHKYVFDGAINFPIGDVEVLRRVKNPASTENLARSLEQFDFGLVDLGALRDVAVRNVELVEDREFGYSVAVNFDEGNISINQNWQKWPDPFRDCGDENCWENLRLAKSDMLPDSQILAIAEEFVQKFGVNSQNYGAPEIQNNWVRELARFVGAESDFYFPENISVVFPLKIQNQTVFSSGGTKEGLVVNVDQRTARASGIYGMTTQNYESSKYAAVTDENLFRKFLERGGIWGGGYFPEGGKIVEVALGEPEEVLLKYWNYENGESSELILPALRFPILENNPNIYQTAVVVPLVAEILEEQNSNPPVFFEEEILKMEEIENDSEQNNSDPDDSEKN